MTGDCFPIAHAITLAEEGGHNPDDVGSETWYGIRRADNPDMPWPPTVEQAAQCARDRYWTPYHFDRLPPPIACAAFDWIFNGGPAIAALQHCLGITVDGRIGPETIETAQRQLGTALLDRYTIARIRYFMGLVAFSSFANPWLTRVLHIYWSCRRLLDQGPE